MQHSHNTLLSCAQFELIDNQQKHLKAKKKKRKSEQNRILSTLSIPNHKLSSVPGLWFQTTGFESIKLYDSMGNKNVKNEKEKSNRSKKTQWKKTAIHVENRGKKKPTSNQTTRQYMK